MQKAREGKWNGGFAPYGYKLVDGNHPKIKELVVFRYHQATELYHSEFLFNLPYGSSFKPFTYDTYESRFHNVMDALKLEWFTPHCTKNTFASQSEICGLRERAIKLIMGHSLKGDVTDYHYKHTVHNTLLPTPKSLKSQCLSGLSWF